MKFQSSAKKFLWVRSLLAVTSLWDITKLVVLQEAWKTLLVTGHIHSSFKILLIFLLFQNYFTLSKTGMDVMESIY